MIMCNIDSETECTILCGFGEGCRTCPLPQYPQPGSCVDYKRRTIESLSFNIETPDLKYNWYFWYTNLKHVLFSKDRNLPLELIAIDILEAMSAL